MARDISSWLPNLLGPLNLFIAGVKANVPRRENINFVSGVTVEDDPDNESTNLTFSGGGGGGGSPATPDKSLQTKNGSAFGSLVYFLREAANRLNVERHDMSGHPELIFSGHTITRGFGSWTTDGVAIGDVIRVIGTDLNDGEYTVTNVSTTVITVAETFVSEDRVNGDTKVTVTSGGFLSYGLAGALLPIFGVHRIGRPASFSTMVWLAILDASGNSIPGLSVDHNGNLMFGSTYDQLNSDAGVVNRPPAIAFWTDFLDLYSPHTDERTLDGAIIVNKRLAHATTSDATPTTISVPAATNGGVYRKVHLTAHGSGGSAVWIWQQSPSGVTLLHYDAAGGSSASWAATWTGGSTASITGAAFASISWQMSGDYR